MQQMISQLSCHIIVTRAIPEMSLMYYCILTSQTIVTGLDSRLARMGASSALYANLLELDMWKIWEDCCHKVIKEHLLWKSCLSSVCDLVSVFKPLHRFSQNFKWATLTKNCCAVPVISHIGSWLSNKWNFPHIHCSFTGLVETDMGAFDQKLKSSSDHQPYWSVMRADLCKVVNWIFHMSHKPFHRFCWSSVWETFTNMHFIIPVFV